MGFWLLFWVLQMTLAFRSAGVWLLFGVLLAACGGGKGTASSSASTPTTGSTAFSLAVTIAGSGTVTSAPSGINCSGTTGCSSNFNQGATVTLSAVAAAGYSFSGWSGGCTGTVGSCSLTMSSAQSVRASFALTGTSTGPVPTGAPVVLYTDIGSGPNSGGENNNGAYLSIFGKNFGSSGLGTTVKVTIGGVEVASYRYLGASKGRTDIQQITVQVGGLGSPTPGSALPIQVAVNGTGSNTDQSFIVNPGRMLYVDNVNGNDATAVPGDITHPYRHVQTPTAASSAFDALKPGDIIVMRGSGTAWSDLGVDTYLVKFIGKNGSAPTGASGTGPFTLMGYPTEDVFINMDLNTSFKGAISGVDASPNSGYTGGRWITIADLRMESGGHEGVIAVQIDGDHWRIVNNEMSAATGAASSAMAGGINGNGTNSLWVGNHIHDVAGSSALENHGIYIDGDGSYEVAYNLIEHVTGGSGFQIYVNGGNGSTVGNNVNLHHNLIHDITKYGINIADGSQNNIVVYDNVVYNVIQAGLRFNTNTLHGAKIYNNTFYNSNTNGNTYYGIISNDWVFPSDALDMQNNVFVLTNSSIPYTGGSVGMSRGIGTVANNLYYGGAGSPSVDSAPVIGNPLFVSTSTDDLHLTSGSPAIDAGSSTVPSTVATDYDVTTPRLVGTKVDLGAFEFQ